MHSLPPYPHWYSSVSPDIHLTDKNVFVFQLLGLGPICRLDNSFSCFSRSKLLFLVYIDKYDLTTIGFT
jgi:hypothetical protein